MKPLQKEIIESLHVQPEIDPKEEIRRRVDFLKNYALKSHASGFVLGLSLGQDSTLAGKIAQMAVDELNKEEDKSYQFLGVRLPYSEQKDEEDAPLVMDFIQPDHVITFNIAQTVDQFKVTYDSATTNTLGDFQKGNAKARIRMVAQYAFAGENNLLVIGTDHAAEAITGFYTKYGDGACDVLPLIGLNKRQGKALLKELGAPERLYEKAPTADLLDEKPLQPDEVELGLKYEEIDDYLEGKKVPSQVAEKIEQHFLKTHHKRANGPATMYDNWWQ